MSLIQEALKRKSQESSGDPTTPDSSGTPLAPPTQPSEQQSSGHPRTLATLLVVLLTLLLLAIVTGIAIYLTRTPLRAPERPTSTAPTAPTQGVTNNTAAQEKIDPSIQPPPPSRPSPEDSLSVATDPNRWPELRLSGISYSKTRQAAVINGKLLTAGQHIGEVAVLDVRRDEITVEYRNKKRIISLHD